MKASELRIGNYIRRKSTGEEFAIDVMKIALIDAENIDAYEKSFDPIQLTQEWLLRFGFGKSDEHELGHNTDEQFGFYYDWHFKRFRIECANSVDVPMKHIQFVHQLQNLYFALTGEELR